MPIHNLFSPFIYVIKRREGHNSRLPVAFIIIVHFAFWPVAYNKPFELELDL